MTQGHDDAALARTLAHEAGQLLMALRASGALAGRALGAEGDLRANRYLVDMLRAQRPGDAILSEEEKDDAARFAASRVWIVDPLDGTREYSEGRDDWAVHVALAIDGVARVGAVALPAAGVTLDSGTVGRNRVGVNSPNDAAPVMVVSRTRPPDIAVHVAEQLGATLLPMGSAGAKAMAVVRGQADIYLHAGGQYEWDNAAPVAVALAAGLHCSRIDGAPLTYNNADAYVPDLIICRPALADAALAAVAAG
jgi:3'(2'), 5'-bisphosphate nucleotidase